MPRRLLPVALLALGACAHFGGSGKPRPYGAFMSEDEARSLATTFGCDVARFKSEYADHRRQPVAVGAPFCQVLGRFGDPEYVGRTDVLSAGAAQVRYKVDQSWYRVSTSRRGGTWVVTSASMVRR